MNLREALIQQAPSLALQRAAADEIARLDVALQDAHVALTRMQAPFDLAVKDPAFSAKVATIVKVSEAQVEGAIRDKLIALGWTPPGEAHA